MRDALGPALGSCRAVVWDVDGVITDSAPLHAATWQEAFDACLRARGTGAQRRPFDPEAEYRRYVDGRPRLDGAAAFLAARGLDLPEGDPEDPPGTDSVRAVAARKNELFTARLPGGVSAWPDAVRLLRALRTARVPCAAVSASRHADDLLTHSGTRTLVRELVDGHEAARLRLPGKPDPAVFREAARRLAARAAPGTAVVEDAVAGVEAGHRGGFSPVIGVNRTADPAVADGLRERGAHVVVGDLAELLEE